MKRTTRTVERTVVTAPVPFPAPAGLSLPNFWLAILIILGLRGAAHDAHPALTVGAPLTFV